MPFVITGWVAVGSTRDTLEQGAGDRMEVAAVNAGDAIDRNLFERYGDDRDSGVDDQHKVVDAVGRGEEVEDPGRLVG